MNYKDKMGTALEKGMNQMALKMVKRSVNSTCIWAIHQPKMPQEAKQFK